MLWFDPHVTRTSEQGAEEAAAGVRQILARQPCDRELGSQSREGVESYSLTLTTF